MTSRPAALAALPPLLSAFLFGITTPLAKQLLASAHPVLVAGLLYTGSGVGLSLYILARDRGRFSIGIPRSEWRWLGGAVIVGGITAPALLMYGLTHADAAAATLLLNLEVVFTALIAWVVFREATSRRVIAGFVAILLGSVLLALPDHGTGGTPIGALVAILAACLCWAIDNNCTQRISSGDARAIAAVKGLVAGTSNVGLAAVLGATFPEATHVAAALALGFLG